MPRHDYVKSGRLAVTEKTKPINIYLHILNYISNLFIFIKKLVSITVRFCPTKKKIFLKFLKY